MFVMMEESVMKRSFHAFDLVQLPRLDAAGAQALGSEVLTVARSKELPEPLAESLAELSAAHRALVSTAAARLPLPRVDPAVSKAADSALDASWSALFDVLGAWAKLPNHPRAAVAASLQSQIFPEGLKFLMLAYKLEWAESNTRLKLIKSRELDAEIEALGAASILKTLRDAHRRYGEVLGITALRDEEEPTALLREMLDAFAGALRQYVVRVAASVRSKDPSSAELAAELLSPIVSWQTPVRSTPVEPEPQPVPPAPPTPTPPTPSPDPPVPVPDPAGATAS